MAIKNEMTKAAMVALVSFGLLKSLPEVAYASFCGFIKSCAAQKKMCAYCNNNTDNANKIGIIILTGSAPDKKLPKIMAHPTIDGIQNIKLNSNLLVKGTNGLTGLVFVI